MKMHDKNGCDSQRFKIKKIMAMNLLLLMCSWGNAETYLSDHQLAEQQSDAKHMDTQSIQRLQKSIQQPVEQQQQESKALSNQNSQEIQQQTID